MQTCNQQLKLADAIRYLKAHGKYALQQPVQKLDRPAPILTQFKQDRQAQRNG